MIDEKVDKLGARVEDLVNRLEVKEKEMTKEDKKKENAITAGGFKPVSHSSSQEMKSLGVFGCSSVKDLLHVNTADPKYAHVPWELKQQVVQLKSDVDVSRFIQQICNGEQLDRSSQNKDGEVAGYVKGLADGNYFAKNVLAPKLKAFGSSTEAEWIPTAVSSQYIEEFELQKQLMAQFRSVPMPTPTYDLPIQTSVQKAKLTAENTATLDGSPFGTDKISMTAQKLSEFNVLPEEVNEDSAPNILASAREEVVEAILRSIEEAIINGDDSVAHQDSDVTLATDSQKAWKGLRKLALDAAATEDFLNAAVTIAPLRNMRASMGKLGVNPADLCWLVTPKTYNQFLGLDETTTVEKFGAAATILRGSLQALDGIPIVISEFARDDLNATGVFDGVTDDRSGIVLFNRRRFFMGIRRPLRVKAVMDPTPPNDRWLLASWWRGDYKSIMEVNSEVSAVYGFNIA